jgi:hypothetical protein
VVKDANRKRQKVTTPSHPPTNTKRRLVALLKQYAASWPKGDFGLNLTRSVVPDSVCTFAENIKLTGYVAIIYGPAIDKLYRDNIEDLRSYVDAAEGAL